MSAAASKSGHSNVPPHGVTASIPIDELVRTRDSLVTGLTNISNALNEFVRSYVQHTNKWVGTDSGHPGAELAGIGNLFSSASNAAVAPLTAAINNATEPITTDKKGKKDKKPRKPKDPNAPKRPLTAYFLYTASARPVVKQDFEDNHQIPTNQEIQNEILKRWSEMTEEEKNGWKAIYEKNAEKYRAEVKAYVESTGKAASAEDLAADVDAAVAGAQDEAPGLELTSAAPPASGASTAVKPKKAAAPKSKKKDTPTATDATSPSSQLVARSTVPLPNPPPKAAGGAKAAPRKRKSAAARGEDETAPPQKKPRKSKAAEDVDDSSKTPAKDATAGAEGAKEKPKSRKPRKSKTDA